MNSLTDTGPPTETGPALAPGAPGLDLTRSRALQERAHALVPGGCHTYAKGDDQWPRLAPGFIARGSGCRVWDVDGNEYVEYGMGCRAVTLGHAFPRVVEAARRALDVGTNFSRPHPIEIEAAEALLARVPGAEMVKFAKNGSDATTAAIKLARAATGRDMVALCADHPFFSIDDWFIGTTEMNAGIPEAVRSLSARFPYGDLAALRAVFAAHPGRIAAVILEPAKYSEPPEGYLQGIQALCRAEGAVFVLDEMITGFRWAAGGAQTVYGVVPDLSTFGKALANGFSASALVGRRELMERGGLHHDGERVFLLSTTHGAESHALAAAIETIRTYVEEPVIETLARQGERLRAGVEQVARAHGLSDHVKVIGSRGACLVHWTAGPDGRHSQAFRALFLQETIRRGVLATSFVVSYSHDDEAIDRTVEAVDGALVPYARALEDGVERWLDGPPTRTVDRRWNR